VLLQDEFEIDATLGEAWALLTDLGRIAPCMPGADLEGCDGDAYIGSVRVKVGPIEAHLRGRAAFVERDAATFRAVIEASGNDPRGQASASALVHARLEPVSANCTRVLIDTDLDISGRVAQFGRGVIGDVSRRLLSQFATNLGSQLQPGATGSTVEVPAPRTPSASVDELSLMGPVLRARLGLVLAGLLLGLLLSWLALGRKLRT